jgi:hypothetical protein
MDKIRKLIELLLNPYDVDDKEAIIQKCEACYSNPDDYLVLNDAHWLLDLKDNGILEFSITNEIFDILLVGDKIDEIHELMADDIEEPFPEKFWKDVKGYFHWVDEKLSSLDPPLQLIEMGDSYSDNLQLLRIYKADSPEIEQLCSEFNIHFKKTAY